MDNLGQQEIVIRLQDVSKRYRLYRAPIDRLKEALHPFKKKYYADFYALRDINLDIPSGQTWGIIGLNGSGKSTMLKILCGVLQPTHGDVAVKGRISALLELGSGFNPEFTGRQNVFFAGAIVGVNRRDMERRFDEIVDFADIGDFLDQPVKNYSSGMLVRLAFAVAIHVSPDILVIDEALAVGDAPFQHKCMAKIRSFQGKSTILFVSHDLNAMVTLCDRIVWLHQGRIIDMGFPKEIVRRYTQSLCEQDDESISARESVVTGFGGDAQCFGTGGAEILECNLRSRERGGVDSVFGGEAIMVDMVIRFVVDISAPIMGITIKNRLGVEMLGVNSDMLDKKLPAGRKGRGGKISFGFTWPHLAPGSYSVSAAIGEKRDGGWVVHHWIHDAIVFYAIRSAPAVGLLAVEDAVIEYIIVP